MLTGPTTAPRMSVAIARGSNSCHPRATSSCSMGINLASCILADLWFPQDSMACKSRRRPGSEMGNSGWWDPISIRSEKRRQSGWESNRGARSLDWRNSEPGVTAQKGWSRMIAATRSQSWAARRRPLCCWAASSNSKRNKGGPFGGDGSARMDDKVSARRMGAREGNLTRDGRQKGVALGEESAGCSWLAPPRGVMEGGCTR